MDLKACLLQIASIMIDSVPIMLWGMMDDFNVHNNYITIISCVAKTY